MTRILIVSIFSLVSISGFNALALDLTSINFRHQYDINDLLTFNHRIIQQGDRVDVFFRLQGDYTYFDLVLLVQDSYDSPTHDTLSFATVDTLFETRQMIYFKLTIDSPDKSLLILSCSGELSEKNRVYEMAVKSPVGFPSFLPLDSSGLPILENYVVEDQLQIQSELNTCHVYRYSEDFGAADPAMGLMKPIAPTLQIDSAYYVDTAFLEVKPYYFYLFQEDSTSNVGLTLLACPSYYPKFKKIEELVSPLTYITTPNENKAINDQMTKKAFESFWLTTYNTKLRAKTAIKSFYNKVEAVNTLFTDYKQGWKTDRGVIYMIFGLPDEVIRSERTEIWRYTDGPQFEFIRLSTLFTSSLYSLRRDRKYEQIWYNQVGNIREGK